MNRIKSKEFLKPMKMIYLLYASMHITAQKWNAYFYPSTFYFGLAMGMLYTLNVASRTTPIEFRKSVIF